jgi:exopolysaccharide production protein ExoZ
MAEGDAKDRELYGVQMLRGLAAFAVVVNHALKESNDSVGRFSPDWLTTVGAGGVDVFFVISGFIMLYVSFAPKGVMSPIDFIARRFIRIYPLYWVCALLVIVPALAGVHMNHVLGVGDGLRSFFLLPSEGKWINVSWTLVYELFFYLVFAVMLIWRSRRVAVLGCSAIIALSTVAWVFLRPGAIREFFQNPISLEFCFGLLLAWGFATGRVKQLPWATAVLGLALMIAATFIAPHNTGGLDPNLMRVLCWGLPAVLVVATFLRVGHPIGRVARFLVYLGDASYAVYLIHPLVMMGLRRLVHIETTGRFGLVLVVFAVVTLSVLTGIVLHQFVELPLIRLVRRAIPLAKPRLAPTPSV